MFPFKEYRLEPVMESVHVQEGYENVCETCPNWGPACESCGVSVPIVADEYRVREVYFCVMDICGIPIGEPYEISESAYYALGGK